MHVVRSGEKRVLVIVKNVQKIRAKKNLGSATSSGTNGSDVVMVCVSLRGARIVGRRSTVTNQGPGSASNITGSGALSDSVKSFRLRLLQVVPVVLILILSVPSGGLIVHISTTHLLLLYVLIIY